MKKIICLSLYCISIIRLSAVSDIINSVGTIDDENQFTLYFDTKSKSGSVQFQKFEKSSKECIQTESYSIKSFEVIGIDTIVANNDLILKTEKGDFFIPKWRSQQKAMFNQKPLTYFVRAEDLYAATYEEFPKK